MKKDREQLSALDAAFLFFDQPAQPLVVACLAELDGPVSIPALVARIKRELAAHPRFRQRPVRAPLDLERPTWKSAAFSPTRHVRRVQWPKPGDDRALRERVERLLSAPLDPSRPLWEVVLIDGARGRRSALLFRAHHCMLDGMSGARLIEALCDPASDDATEGDLPATSATPVLRTERGRAKRRRARDDSSFLASMDPWERMRDLTELLSTSISLFHDDPAPPTPLNGRLSARRRIAWATHSLSELAAVRTSSGCTVNDLALAVISGALRRYLWRRRRSATRAALRALVPVSVRPSMDESPIGNAVSAMFPRLPIQLADPLERLEWIASETRALKERGQPRATAFLLAALGGMPSAIEAFLPRVLPDTRVFNTICTNVPGPRQERRLVGRRILALHGIVPLFQGMGVEFGVMSHADRVSICAHFDPTLLRDGDALARDLAQSFLELSRAQDRHAKPRRAPEPQPLAALLRPPSRYRSPDGASEPMRNASEAQRRSRAHSAPS